MRHCRFITCLLLSISLVSGCEKGSEQPVIEKHQARLFPSPVTRKAYFGDLHLHTGLSFDAAAAGTRTTPEDAYRFAMGEEVTYFGRKVKRNVPLDFLAVTDHSEYLGVALGAAEPDGIFAGTEWPAKIAAVKDDMLAYMRFFSPAGFRGEDPVPEFVTEKVIRTNWRVIIDAAQKYNQPGKFTTFVAYEWSPMPGGAHIHRNVIFRGPNFPAQPFSAIDSMKPEDLWTYAETNRRSGIDSIMIPHNSNLSEGLTFAPIDSYGNTLTSEYALRRIENERLVEITQIKGTSETRPRFSPEDEFASFELINYNQNGDFDLKGGYVRPALGRGLEIRAKTGVNPFEFGLIGSSDFHSGVSASEESNYPGGLGSGDEQSDPIRVLTSINPLMQSPTTIMSASGLTGVWAEENTRETLFAALKRREVFATSGTRLQVRLFAGRKYPISLIKQQNWLKKAYELGVPMGSVITPEPVINKDAPLTFLFQAIKDPDGANLDRIQIIKIWYVGGQSHEKVFDVAWSDDRNIDTTINVLPLVENTVDLKTASYTNSIGANELTGEWTDPEFDAGVSSIYYARVLEIPTPRWSTYLAVQNNLPVPADVPATIQERAWTSPIFYLPVP